jgi:hypothetical protein
MSRSQPRRRPPPASSPAESRDHGLKSCIGSLVLVPTMVRQSASPQQPSTPRTLVLWPREHHSGPTPTPAQRRHLVPDHTGAHRLNASPRALSSQNALGDTFGVTCYRGAPSHSSLLRQNVPTLSTTGITMALHVRSTCSHMGRDSDERADLAAFRVELPAPQLLPSAR